MEEFQIHSHYDHKSLKTMSRVLRKTVRRKRNIAFRIFGWAVVALEVLTEAALVMIDAFSLDFGNVLTILAGVFMLVVLLFEDDLNGWIAKLSLMPGTREADTHFGPEEYVVTTQAAETRMHYENISVLGETKDSFVFIIGKRHAQQFPKDGLSEGTPEQFRDFIAEKTGLSVWYVK